MVTWQALLVLFPVIMNQFMDTRGMLVGLGVSHQCGYKIKGLNFLVLFLCGKN